MISSFFRKNKEKEDKWSRLQNFGLTVIYNDLLSQALPIQKIKAVVGNVLFSVAGAFAMIFTFISIKNGLSVSTYILWSIYLFIIFSTISIAIGWFVGFISFAISFKPHISRVIANLIISVKAPFSEQFGLNANNIQHLKNIAATDQAAADWKNGFLSVGILAILFTVIQWSSSEIGTFLQEIIIIPPQTLEVNNIQNYGIFLLWGISAFIIFGLTFSIFAPFVEFLANEPINRGILNACEEAIALLETLRLHKKESLTMKDKEQIADLLLCQIVPKPTDNRYWGLKTSIFKDRQKKEWILLPPAAVIDDSVRKAEERVRKQKLFFENTKNIFSKKSSVRQKENIQRLKKHND